MENIHYRVLFILIIIRRKNYVTALLSACIFTIISLLLDLAAAALFSAAGNSCRHIALDLCIQARFSVSAITRIGSDIAVAIVETVCKAAHVKALTIARLSPAIHVEALTITRLSPAVHVEALTVTRLSPAVHIEALTVTRLSPAIHVEALTVTRLSPAVHVEALSVTRLSPAAHVEALLTVAVICVIIGVRCTCTACICYTGLDLNALYISRTIGSVAFNIQGYFIKSS